MLHVQKLFWKEEKRKKITAILKTNIDPRTKMQPLMAL